MKRKKNREIKEKSKMAHLLKASGKTAAVLAMGLLLNGVTSTVSVAKEEGKTPIIKQYAKKETKHSTRSTSKRHQSDTSSKHDQVKQKMMGIEAEYQHHVKDHLINESQIDQRERHIEERYEYDHH